MTPIALKIGGLEFVGELFDTPAAAGIAAHLPLEIKLSRWGEEYYGAVGGGVGPFPGKQIEEMAVGDLAYWEPGNALCLFFGPTPASRGTEPRAASPVHRIGTVSGDWTALRRSGGTVTARLSVRP